MKRLLITMSIVLISVLGFSQATNVADYRVATATTTFDVNLPIGTKVYNIATEEYWVATAGIASTLTLTTGSTSFVKLNPAAAGAQNLSFNTGTHSVDITAGGSSALIPLGTTSADGLLTTTMFNEIEANTLKNTNVDTELSTGTVTATTYGITSDGGTNDVILPEANTSQAGLLGADKWDEIVANTLKNGNVTTDLSLGTITSTTVVVESSDGTDVTLLEANTNDAGLLGADKWDEIVVNNGKVSNVTTNLSLGTRAGTTMDVNSSDGTNVTLLAANGTQAGLMTTAHYTKLEGLTQGEANLDMATENFEEDDGTATSHSLGHTAVLAQECRVSLNGATLRETDYTLTTTTITIDVPIYQYDQVIITYTY